MTGKQIGARLVEISMVLNTILEGIVSLVVKYDIFAEKCDFLDTKKYKNCFRFPVKDKIINTPSLHPIKHPIKQLKPKPNMTTNTTTTETTTQMNGIYSTEFDKDWEMSKHYIDAVKQIAQRAENIDADQLYQIFDTRTIPDREEANKKLKTKQNKRQKKKAEKFVVAGLAKPKNVRNLFREQYKARLTAEGKTFNKDEFDAAFKALSADAREALDLEVKAANETFYREYEQHLARAVASGDYPEKAPTKFKRAYLIFTEDMRAAVGNTADTRLTATQRTQISVMSMTQKSKAFGELWKTVSEAEKARYTALEKEAEQAYTAEFYDYNVRVLERQMAKAEREGHDAKEYRDRLVEVQLKPPSAEARAVQSKYYGPAAAGASATAATSQVSASAEVVATEKPKKAKKEKQADQAATVVLTTEETTVPVAEKPKKKKDKSAAATTA